MGGFSGVKEGADRKDAGWKAPTEEEPDNTLFTRFVEPGRLALISYGPFEGKLVTVIDIVNQKKVIVDGPTTGVRRHMMPALRLQLTDFKTKIPRGAREKSLKQGLKTDDPI